MGDQELVGRLDNLEIQLTEIKANQADRDVQYKELIAQSSAVCRSTEKIESALLGVMGQPGLLEEFRAIKRDFINPEDFREVKRVVMSLEQSRNKVWAWCAAISVAITAGYAVFKDFIHK